MMCNRSIELHPYEHITKMERRAWRPAPRMGGRIAADWHI